MVRDESRPPSQSVRPSTVITRVAKPGGIDHIHLERARTSGRNPRLARAWLGVGGLVSRIGGEILRGARTASGSRRRWRSTREALLAGAFHQRQMTRRATRPWSERRADSSSPVRAPGRDRRARRSETVRDDGRRGHGDGKSCFQSAWRSLAERRALTQAHAARPSDSPGRESLSISKDGLRVVSPRTRDRCRQRKGRRRQVVRSRSTSIAALLHEDARDRRWSISTSASSRPATSSLTVAAWTTANDAPFYPRPTVRSRSNDEASFKRRALSAEADFIVDRHAGRGHRTVSRAAHRRRRPRGHPDERQLRRFRYVGDHRSGQPRGH